MNGEVAAQLFERGATLILLDLAPGAEFGVDWKSWHTDVKFKGLKMIPPGTHYVYYSVKSKSTSELAPRSGFFHHFSPKEVMVRRWDEETGGLVEVDALTLENIQKEENLKTLDPCLGAYPYECYKQWCGLSSHIDQKLIKRVQPKSGRIDAVVNFIPVVDQNNRTKVDRQGLPILDRQEHDAFGFATVGRKWWPEDSTPAERSAHAQDSTWVLGELMKHYDGEIGGLLGEFQFAYLAFVIGQVMSAFDHWKQLLRVFCHVGRPTDAVLGQLVPVLYFQMKTMPEDFMVDIVSSSNVVLACLNVLFKLVHESGNVGQSARGKLNKFRAYCEAKFGWKFYEDGEESEEDDEDKPVVVEL